MVFKTFNSFILWRLFQHLQWLSNILLSKSRTPRMNWLTQSWTGLAVTSRTGDLTSACHSSPSLLMSLRNRRCWSSVSMCWATRSCGKCCQMNSRCDHVNSVSYNCELINLHMPGWRQAKCTFVLSVWDSPNCFFKMSVHRKLKQVSYLPWRCIFPDISLWFLWTTFCALATVVF